MPIWKRSLRPDAMPKSKGSAGSPVWKARFTQSAEADIDAILVFIADRDGIEQAEELLRLFRQGKESLSSLPLRGHFPPELARLHISNFREIHVGVYRMIYQAAESECRVYIHAVLDARRHVDELLRERLLREAPSPE